jgi:hypothetical protein
MDDIVLRGMVKWPDVPAVYGWLALNRRGQWLIKGDPIGNPAVSSINGRNYERDGAGRWFFQNGPQRVFVSLDYTPLVYRAFAPEGSGLCLEAHTGARATSLSGAWVDEDGILLVETEHGVGLIHDHDLQNMTQAFADSDGNAIDEDALVAMMERLQRGDEAPLWLRYEAALVKVEGLRSSEAPRVFGFEASPSAPEGHPECP